MKQYLCEVACWWTACFHWALALPSTLLFLGRSSVLDSVWRLEIPGRALEPPPCDTLSALHHQHDFHSSPRAGGAPWRKNKQIWRLQECMCTDPAHLALCEYHASVSGSRSACAKAQFWHVLVCVQQDMYSWRTVCAELCSGGVIALADVLSDGGFCVEQFLGNKKKSQTAVSTGYWWVWGENLSSLKMFEDVSLTRSSAFTSWRSPPKFEDASLEQNILEKALFIPTLSIRRR